MFSLSLADSLRVYYNSAAGDSSSDWASVGTFLGFLLVAVAASTVAVSASDSQQRWKARRPLQVLRPSPLRLLLPFLPFLVATVSLVVRLARSDGSPWDEAALGSALLALVLLRLFLAMSDNERLLAELVETRDLLKHQALHDGLTGLANRVLFGDRLDRALHAARPTT